MEFLLVLFLLSGQIKAFMQFFGLNLPVDFTLITGILLMGFTAYKLVRKNTFSTNNVSFFGIGYLLLFYAWMIFSLFYTASEQYSREKTIYFLLNIAAFSVPFFFNLFNIKLFIRIFIVSTIILALGLLPFQYLDLLKNVAEPGDGGAYTAIGGLYLTLSEYLGLIMILLLTMREKIMGSKNYEIVTVLFVLGLMVLLGARGPIVFALIVYSFFRLSKITKIHFTIKTRSLVLLSSVFCLLSLGIFLMTRFPATDTLLRHSLYRFYSLLGGAVDGGMADHSSTVRLVLAKEAFEGIFKDLISFLFGYGTGSFGIITTSSDIRLYPHNMILEIWFELGLIGLMVFFVWIVYILTKLRGQPNQYISYWLMFYIFLNLMKSSSLVDVRTEFALFALLAVQNFQVAREPKLAPV